MATSGSSSLPLQPKSLAHLPKELLQLVASSLDITSALSLLTTSKQLSEPVESRIWSEVDLSLPHHHGEHPLIRPFAHGSQQYCDWAKGEAKAAEHRARDDLDQRVKEIMTVSNKRRLGYVRKLDIMARAGSATSSAFFLSCVAPRLEALTIVPPLKHIWDENWQPEYHETFYSKLHDLGSSSRFRLPALRSLDITLSTGTEYVDSILLLLKAAGTTLEELRLELPMSMQGIDPDMERTGPVYPDGDCELDIQLYKLKHLTLICPGELDETLDRALRTADVLCTVSIRGSCGAHPDLDENFMDHLRSSGVDELKWTKRHMTELIWECYGWNDGCEPAFYCVNLLVLEHQQMTVAPCIEFTPIPAFRQLETLLIKVPSWKPLSTSQSSHKDMSPFDILLNDYHPIPQALADWLRNETPDLQVIQYFPHKTEAIPVNFKHWDARDCQGAFIRSFWSVDDPYDSLLHVRSRTQWLTAKAFDATYPPGTNRTLASSYPTDLEENWKTMVEVDGETPQVEYIHAPECQWTDMTDYRGYVVPPEILLRMQRAEGLTSAQSQEGRGINVGPKGWKIIQDWYKEQEDAKAAKNMLDEVEETVDEVPNSQQSV